MLGIMEYTNIKQWKPPHLIIPHNSSELSRFTNEEQSEECAFSGHAGNTVKHNHKHIDELEEQLNQLGITKEGYAEFVAKNYNQIRLGNKPYSLVLAVLLENANHIAAVHLHYDKNEEFWLVTTVHAIKLKDLEKIPLIWEKKWKRGEKPPFFRQLPMPPDRLLSLSVSCLTHINARCGGLGIETLQR